MGDQPSPALEHNGRSLVRDVEDAVKHEMYHSAYNNTTGVTATLLGDHVVPKAFVDKVYKALSVAKGVARSPIYKPEQLDAQTPGHWVGLPPKPENEHVLYGPLTKVLNAITEECATQLKVCREQIRKNATVDPRIREFCQDESKFKLDIVWRDEHSKKLMSPPEFMSDMRPDIVATFKAAGSGPVWWRSIHIPLEVKQPANPLSAAVQLLRYVRQALREQPDRRFMYGLVFAKRSLTVWHVDRSGALGSKTIDVHKYPKIFIRTIIALLTKSPAALGWDPTMLISTEDDDGNALDPVPSYETSIHKSLNAYDTRWVVWMDKPLAPGQSDSADREQEKFVLYFALSLARGEVIKGRATRIWRAWRWADLSLPEEDRGVYVFKDTWRDERRGIEGDLYMKAGSHGGEGRHGVAKLYSHGVVRIEDQVDNTLMLIRQNVQPVGSPVDLETRQKVHTSQSREDDFDAVDTAIFPVSNPSEICYSWDEDYFHFDGTSAKPFNRIHSRLVMTSTGWPLLKFKDLPELFGGVHDAIEGHKWLYERGILHRDISYGNILLTGRDAPHRGLLIDLDNAIEYKDYFHKPDDVRSVGTLAFMSHEVLSWQPYYPSPSGSVDHRDDSEEHVFRVNVPSQWTRPTTRTRVEHTAIHDLESFFWVLCFIALYREGPGALRSTWRTFTAEEAADIRAWLRRTFEAPNIEQIAAEKHKLMTAEGYFEFWLVDNVAPYFVGLMVPVLRFLHNKLRSAYMRRDLDNLYKHFLHILHEAAIDEHSKAWNETQETYKRMEDVVLAWRARQKITWDSPTGLPVAENKRGASSDALDGQDSAENGDDERPRKIAKLPARQSSPTPGAPAAPGKDTLEPKPQS